MPRGVPKTKNPDLYQVAPNITAAVNPLVENNDTKIFTIIQTLAKSVQKLSEDVKDLQTQKSSTPLVPAETPVAPAPVSVSSFLSAVPADLLTAAKDILGNKFVFECSPATDKPFFDFVVIVPAEYSDLPAGVQDRRTKMISNAAGVEEVKKWCELVKSNVIRKLGKALPVNA